MPAQRKTGSRVTAPRASALSQAKKDRQLELLLRRAAAYLNRLQPGPMIPPKPAVKSSSKPGRAA